MDAAVWKSQITHIKVNTISESTHKRSVRLQLQGISMTLSCFQSVSVRGVLPIGTLGRYPRLRSRRFRLEHRLSFSERSAHSHTSLPLLTSTALDGAHRTILEAVQTIARQQEAFQGTDPRGSAIAPGTR